MSEDNVLAIPPSLIRNRRQECKAFVTAAVGRTAVWKNWSEHVYISKFIGHYLLLGLPPEVPKVGGTRLMKFGPSVSSHPAANAVVNLPGELENKS